jgi:uncharacterized protein YbdZ (MbtH family)
MGMSLSESEEYGIVVNGGRQFGIWSLHRRLPVGWSFTGPTGTQEEMRSLLRRQLVEVVAIPTGPSRRWPRGLGQHRPDA